MLNPLFFDEDIVPISQNYSAFGQLVGQNKKQTLVILSAEQYGVSEYKTLMEKVLASVQVDVAQDVLVFALADKRPFSLLHLAEKENCTKIIVFGSTLSQMGVHRVMTKYEIHQINDFQLVISDSFHDLELDASKKLKLALWNTLKKLFGK